MRFHHATEDDIPFINSVLNHPACRGEVGPDVAAALDYSKTLKGAEALVFEGGVIFGQPINKTDALVLGAFLPEYRGLYAFVAHRHAIREAFAEMGFNRLVATIKHDNSRSARNAIGLGFWNVMEIGDRIVMDLDYLRWSQTDPLCSKIGMTTLLRNGLEPISHDEPGALGALWLTIVGGHRTKAIKKHTEWSILGGNPFMCCSQENPEDECAFEYRGTKFHLHGKRE